MNDFPVPSLKIKTMLLAFLKLWEDAVSRVTVAMTSVKDTIVSLWNMPQAFAVY